MSSKKFPETIKAVEKAISLNIGVIESIDCIVSKHSLDDAYRLRDELNEAGFTGARIRRINDIAKEISFDEFLKSDRYKT